jgi:hypothetical protein
MLAARTIENEYLRDPFDVQDGADKLHWLPAMAQGRRGSLICHEIYQVRALIQILEGQAPVA